MKKANITRLMAVFALMVLAAALGVGAIVAATAEEKGGPKATGAAVVALPAPSRTGTMSFEEVLAKRRSIRAFRPDALSAAQVGQILWAGQGITDPARGLRTSPSAGATYPIELYVATAAGIDHYLPATHSVERFREGDARGEMAAAAYGQATVARAPAVFIIAAATERTAGKYGARAREFVDIEAGHTAQNMLLQATALSLGAVPIGGMDNDKLSAALKLPSGTVPVYLVAVGAPAGK